VVGHPGLERESGGIGSIGASSVTALWIGSLYLKSWLLSPSGVIVAPLGDGVTLRDTYERDAVVWTRS
ncbi:hypothetical protein, partial [Nonomuraea terrae]|uniref:hypothetical protein n=1 Tax=Nonomuraea terrae TaxID=2530383 RepID=UPI001CB752E9